MKLAAATSLIGLSLCATSVLAQPTHTISPADIVNLKQVLAPQISPDGKTIAYTVHTPVSAVQHTNSRIWIVATDGRSAEHPLSSGAEVQTSPQWSPDGKTLAFLSDGFTPGGARRSGLQLWTVPSAGGKQEQLTSLPGSITSFQWSRDGKFLAFVLPDVDSEQLSDRKKLKEDHRVEDEDLHFDRLWIYDLAQHRAYPALKDDMSVFEFDWSPSNTKLVARVFQPKREDPFRIESKIMILDLTSGHPEKVICETAARNNILRWSPDGSRIAMTEEGLRSHWLTIYSMATGKRVRIGDSYAGTVSGVEWSPDSKTLVAQAVQNAHAVFAKVDAETGVTTTLGEVHSHGSIENLSLSADGSRIAYLEFQPNHPAEVALFEQGRPRLLTHTNLQVADWKLGEVKEVSWKSTRDGKTIYGVLVLPAGYQPGKAYKAVIQAHGGPEGIWVAGWLGAWNDWAQILASHGYAVLLPNFRGSDGQGTAFLEADYQDWGGGDFQDVMDGVDWLVAQGIADPNHLGFGGWSYGGYMTSWTVTHTDRFKAAVQGAGMPDLPTLSVTMEIQPDYMHRYFGPEVSRDMLERHSAIHFLQQCHTPLLLLHGEADTRVPTTQSWEFYNGLRMAGKETKLVLYPRENHAIAEYAHQQDLLTRMLDWYESRLN